MSKETYVGGTATITSKGEIVFNIYDGDANFNTNGTSEWTAKEGHFVGDYEEMELPKRPEQKAVDETHYFTTGWWSKDFDGEIRVDYDTADQTGFRAQLEDIVYFQLRVNKKVPLGTKIKFKLWDYDSTFFMDWANFDDDDFGKDGKELFKTGTVRDAGDEEYYRITIKLYLTPDWIAQLEEDKGAFKDGCLDFHWTWMYNNTDTTMNKKLRLSVYYNRNLFIKEASSKYRFPEVIDSQTGDFIVFLKNEAGDVVGDINSKIDHFYAVRITVTSKYEFEGRTNKVTKQLYEEKINLHTGKSSKKKLFEVQELVAFKAKNSSTLTKLESTTVAQVKKKFSDYYNVYDIGKYGLKGLQEAMNLFGYIDLVNDLSDTVAGKGLSTYDTNGVMIAAAQEATKVAMAQETKLGIMSTEEIALMSLPEWVNPLAFGLAIFEETISKPFVSQIMQDISDSMFMRMEMAKRGGLQVVRDVVNENQMKGYYELITDISQQKHNKVFAGKIKTYKDLKKDNSLYHSENPESKTYTYLLALIEKDDEVIDYNIDTIFV